MAEKINSNIGSLYRIIRDMLPHMEAGSYATNSFSLRYSRDCNFLEYTDHSEDHYGWKFLIEFYPGLASRSMGIDNITLLMPNESWTINFGVWWIERFTTKWPRARSYWQISSVDTAHLFRFEVMRQGGGSVSYARNGETMRSNEWSHGVTVGYPWTKNTPSTLKDSGHKLIENVCGMPVVPIVSVKETVDRIVRVGKLLEFATEMHERCKAAA